MATTAAWIASADDGTDQSTYTFSGVAIGAAAADRRVVVGIGARGSTVQAVISSVTIGGVTASFLDDAVPPNNAVSAFYAALVPTGTTAEIVVTFTAACLRCGVDVFRVTGWGGILHDSTGDITTSGANVLGDDNTPISCPAGSSILGIAHNHGSQTSWSWSGLTERSDRAPEVGESRFSAACDDFASAQTDLVITATKTASANTGTALALIALSLLTSFDASVAITEGGDTLSAQASYGSAAAITTEVVWQAAVDDSTDLAAYTFTSVAIGAQAADRHVVVGIGSRGSLIQAVISGVTIGGGAATFLYKSPDANRGIVAFYAALVPTGTTADIVVTFTDTQFRCGIDVFRVVGWDGVLYDSTNDITAPSNILGDSTNISCPAGGSILGMACNHATTGSWSWIGLTEKSDRTVDAGPRYSAASDNFATAQVDIVVTATKTASASTAPTLVLIALGPPTLLDVALAVTEDGDTAAVAASLALEAALAATEEVDTLSAAASLALNAVVAVTGSGDTLSATASLALSGAVAVSEAGDTLLASGTAEQGPVFAYGLVAFAGLEVQEVIEAAALIAEADDTLSADVVLTAELTLNIVQAGDTVVATTELPIQASLSRVEANDALVAAASLPVLGVASLTEANDTAVSAATLPADLVLTAVEQGDLLAGVMSIGQLASLVLAITEEEDTVVGEADITIATLQVAVAVTEQNDTSTGAALIEQAALLVFAATEQGDTIVAAATITIAALQATLAITEASDTLFSDAVFLTDHLQGVLEATEESDTFSGDILIVQDAQLVLDVTEEDDTAVGASLVEQDAFLELDVLEQDDVTLSAILVEQVALCVLDITEEDDTSLSEISVEQGALGELTVIEDDDVVVAFVGVPRRATGSGSLRQPILNIRRSNVQSPYLRRSA